MPGKKLIASGVVVAALVGYGTLDAYDLAPGVLTIDRGNTPKAEKVDGRTYEPELSFAKAPALQAPVAQGATPSKDSVRKAVEAALKDKNWGTTTGVTIRDANTGAVLYEKDSAKATTPASITKLVSAFAVAHSKLALNQPLTTSAKLSGDTLHLVAGGDMVLSSGNGDPDSVVGRAGLADLARQTAAALKKQGRNRITVDTNTSYAPGPATAPGWEQGFLNGGFTARITTLALAQDRADDKTPAAQDPTRKAGEAFVKQLKTAGIDATYGKNVTTTPTGTQVGAVRSAPVLDLLGVALQDSDNAMIESLTRQAAASEGVHGDSKKIGAWVVQKVKAAGIDVSGMTLADTCGLSDGTTLPVRIVGDLLVRGTTGKDRAYQAVISRLPVSAWNGTLDTRFGENAQTQKAAGLVRAKTGSLLEVASLAGELQTKENHRLVFAVTTNHAPITAKFAIDALVASLTQL